MSLELGPQELANVLETLAKQIAAGEDGREVMVYRANLRLELRGPDGELKDERDFHNLICTAGKNKLLAVSSNKYINDYAYICIGTGAVAANAADTALGAEVARASGTTSNPTAPVWQNTYTFPAGTGTGAITEAGLDYQNSASGAILARQVFAAVNKGAADTLAVTWQIS